MLTVVDMAEVDISKHQRETLDIIMLPMGVGCCRSEVSI